MTKSWFKVRQDIFNHDLGTKELVTYMYLAYLCHFKGFAIVRHIKISEATGLSVSSVKRAITRLRKLQLITVQRRPNGANKYTLRWDIVPAWMNEAAATTESTTRIITDEQIEKRQQYLLKALGEWPPDES